MTGAAVLWMTFDQFTVYGRVGGAENAGVDNTARDDRGGHRGSGQGGPGNTGQINLTKSNYR